MEYLLKLQGWEGEAGLSMPTNQQLPAKLSTVFAIMKARSIAVASRAPLKALVPSRVSNSIRAVRRIAETLAAMEFSGWATALATGQVSLHWDLGGVLYAAMEPLPEHTFMLMSEGLHFAGHIHEANTWSTSQVRQRSAPTRNGAGMSAWLDAYRTLPFLLEIAEGRCPPTWR